MKTPDNHPSMAKKASRSRVTARRKMASLRIGVQRRQFRMQATPASWRQFLKAHQNRTVS